MDSILFEKQGAVGKLTLNRPGKYNSFNREMALALQDQLDACREDESIRAVYLTGAGKAFSAGQDLSEVAAEDGPELTTILTEHYNPIVTRLRNIEKPIVAAVNGVAAGAGANIALACDIVVAAESAAFIQAFSKIGLIPDSGGTFFLPRLIGYQKAAAIMMLGDKVPAVEAERLGMIYHYFPDEEFAEESWKIATTLSQMPTQGLGLTKRALNYSLDNDLEKQLAIEDQLQSNAGQTEDYAEGVQAFLEKRKPVFKGQ
ncbi:MAG: 2-(1,2-epoxy-1,2-dihydrophenyl)acetyl-CoA isomerase [Bacteroidetes bacterium]|jgi:2-(1,2-epoxy-1,2-dihydrophenyl)acetyl-CoA isomerase|nr:2-(1,2-epoxy-1,2-dihydrophenyl)acetyl-CoA isomerase [Bacteroidota bacterium]